MGRSAEAWGREDDSGMNDYMEWDYHHAEVCLYCGERKGEKLSCCGEIHFDTQYNIDHPKSMTYEAWYEKNHRILNEIHEVVETQIKPF